MKGPAPPALLGIDTRALAVFRMGLGVAVAVDLALRARALAAHYSDAGVLPRAALEADPLGRLLPYLSLHLQGGSPAWQVALFAATALCAAALALGLRTRAAAVATWLLVLSLQNRNPLLHYGGDNVLALLLFWSLFLPLGARFSLDARAGRAPVVAGGVARSVGSAGLLVQVAALHFFSALHKRAPEWIPDGTALEYALHVDKFVRPLGVVLRELPVLPSLLTYGSYALELVGPFLLFAPFAQPALRTLTSGAFLAFHAGIALTMDLVLFSWISMLSMLVFLPAGLWDRLEAGLARRRGAPSPEPATGRARAPRATWVPSPAAQVCAAAALAFVLAWNAFTLRSDWREALEARPWLGWMAAPALWLRLGQTWAMFAPHPPKETRWHAVTGLLEDGRRVDLLFERDAPPRLAKPVRRGEYYPDGRWERLFANLPGFEYADATRSLGAYFCRRGAQRHGARLREVRILVRRDETLPGGVHALRQPRLLARFACRGGLID